jgi:DUF1680 family protein
MSKSDPITRRGFGVLLASPAALAAQAPEAGRAGDRPAIGTWRRPLVADTPAFDAPIEFTRGQVKIKAEPFPMAQVRLLPDSSYYDTQEWNRGYMARLGTDRLLYTFRANAGLPVGSAKPLGGWEQPENGQRSSELRGHFIGHYLSALAQLAASGDKEAKAKGDEMVAVMAQCQQKLGGKYLSAFPATWFDRLEKGERIWAPFYTIHKVIAGTFDMYRLAGNKQALQISEGIAAWANEWTARHSEAQMQTILEIEFGGIAETLYHLAAVTSNDVWAKTGDRFQKKRFINPLAAGRDELRGLHANTHIPQAIAAARRYEISADRRFHNVADFFFHQVTSARSYVTGGTSNAEAWLAPPHMLAAELKVSTNTAECCCAHNMMRLARYLYSWNPDPRYFDYYERLLLNHRIGTIQPQTGHTQYYLSLTSGVWKTFCTEDQTFWCCTGSGVEEYSKLNDSIYWRDSRGVYVNLFVPSVLDWKEKRLQLKLETRFPESEDVTLTVAAASRGALALRVRIPGWLQTAPVVKLNRELLDASAEPGSYLTVNREWKAGDRIELRLPMHLHAESMPDDPNCQAFFYGPLVLAGDLGGDGLTEAHITGPNFRVGAPNVEQNGSPLGPTNRVPPVPDLTIPALRAGNADPSSWIKPVKPLVFRTTGQQTDVQMVPLYSLLNRRYAVYWQMV